MKRFDCELRFSLLSFSKRAGTYPGRLHTRTLRIHLWSTYTGRRRHSKQCRACEYIYIATTILGASVPYAMSLADFRPDSLFGVPLTPVPPGLPWVTTRDMIREVLSDLSLPWVRNFLFGEDAVFDVSILSNDTMIQRALVSGFTTQTDKEKSGGFSGAFRTTRLSIPTHSIGDVGLGVQVEAMSESGTRIDAFDAPLRICRFVSNSTRTSGTNVHILGETVNVNYYRNTTHGLWYFANLFFDRTMFFKAFSNGKDFDIAQLALIRSIAGGMQHEKALQLSNMCYPYKISENYGAHFIPVVACTYANATPVMSLSIFGEANFSFGSDASYLANMRKWALGNRLQRVAIPPVHAPTLKNDSVSESDDSGVIIEEIPTDSGNLLRNYSQSQQKVSARPSSRLSGSKMSQRILPAPASVSSVQIIDQLTPEQHVKRLREAKEERRKIQRRESAARFNAIRKAEREKAKRTKK